MSESFPTSYSGVVTSWPQELTNHDNLYFPIQDSPAGGQAAFLQPACPPCSNNPLCAFYLWTFNSSVQILADFLPKTFRESPSPKRQDQRALRICSRVHRCLAAPPCPCLWMHRQAAGWHRQRSRVALCRVAGNQLGCCWRNWLLWITIKPMFRSCADRASL